MKKKKREILKIDFYDVTASVLYSTCVYFNINIINDNNIYNNNNTNSSNNKKTTTITIFNNTNTDNNCSITTNTTTSTNDYDINVFIQALQWNHLWHIPIAL